MEDEEEVKRPKGCITLTGPDYILEQIEDSSYMFDLKLKRTVHGRNGVDREEFKLEAYGLPLDIAFLRIAMFRMSKCEFKGVDQLFDFIHQYRRVNNFLGKEFKKYVRNGDLRG